MSTFANSEDPDEMQQYAAIGVYTICNDRLTKEYIIF